MDHLDLDKFIILNGYAIDYFDENTHNVGDHEYPYNVIWIVILSYVLMCDAFLPCSFKFVIEA